MAYSTQADLVRVAGGTERFLEICDFEDAGQVDAALVSASIAEADEWINTYAQRRYKVPFASVSTAIANLSAREAIYRLLSSRGMVPELEQTQHEERERWLENLARGIVSPGPDPSPPPSTAVASEILERSPSEDVSRDALKGFW